MEQILSDIVQRKSTAEESVNRVLLERYTERVEGSFLKKIQWGKIKHLYILGSLSSKGESPQGEPPLPVAYEEKTYKRWVLIMGAEDKQIRRYLSRCTTDLEKLVIRFTGASELNVQNLTGLKNLMLENNCSLKQVTGLGQLKSLKKLYLTNTQVSALSFTEPMPELSVFFANKTPLEGVGFLKMLPALRELNLSGTPITSLPSLESLSALRVLTLRKTALSGLHDVAFPEDLTVLDLSLTPMSRLPESVRALKKLKLLDLSNMDLEYLPEWLPELGMEFTLENRGEGIRLNKTRVENVDMSLFAQPREIIVQWFRDMEEKRYVFTGVKVALLGNKEAGKTTLLGRMLHHGKYSAQSSVSGGPQIGSKIFSVNGQQRRVQFWDLNAPDILYRMHSLFQPDRTLFLIVLDAEGKNIRKQAEDWVRELRVYAYDAPVMLVVNKDDLVPDKKRDLEQLRSTYANIKGIVSVSALMDGPEQFGWKFMQPLLHQLLSFPELMQTTPRAWRELAEHLDQNPAPYLHIQQYHQLCEDCGIADENIRMNLLQWFSDMGICLYSDSSQIMSDYVLLQPGWLTSAILYLLNEGDRDFAGGVGSTERLLHRLTTPYSNAFKRTASRDWPGCDYREAQYILEIMRLCHIAIPIDKEWELIPLLCSRRTPKVFSQYMADQQARSARLTGEQLPVEVIHRLMLRMRDDLDRDNIWYYGARFEDAQSGQSVVIRKEAEALQIYALGSGQESYLDHVVSEVKSVAEEIRLDLDSQTALDRRRRNEEVLLQHMGEPDEQEDPNLNEIRVLFLGDGEAGKSETIRRLLKLRLTQDNEPTAEAKSNGDVTPGVEMHHGAYQLVGGRKVHLNFWDFGGQEILHSMHRIFVTKQTVCVIMLNARSDTQDERARYWLRYIGSMSADMPVLLVLNKMDQNMNASINERELRRLYPKVTDIVKMSAVKDDDQAVREKLLDPLLRKIGELDALQTEMPPNWRKIREALMASKKPYIRQEEFEELCRDMKVPPEGGMYQKLLDWFNFMGVSYRCDAPGRMGTYTILRPEWVTNAIYAILINSHADVKNGIVMREQLDKLLSNTELIRCVDKQQKYNPDEVDYVIQIMRRNNLSYCIRNSDGTEFQEFIPMLCQRNESEEARKYEQDPKTIEYWIRFEYLPDTLIFYMMVEHFQSLDPDHIWLKGARFVDKQTGASAIIKRDENVLKLYVRSDRFYPAPARYRDKLRTDVHNIVEKHLPGLRILEELVVLKHPDGIETFDYDRLLLNQDKGISHCVSKLSKESHAIRDLLEQTDNAERECMDQLLDELITACKKMQEVPQQREEDLRNKQIMHILSGRCVGGKELIVMDQSQGGWGKSGIKLGERDLIFCTKSDVPWVILEALNVTGTGEKKNWRAHLDKLLDNYNPHGLKTLITVSYVNGRKDGFGRVWKSYRQEIETYSPEKYPLVPETVQPYRAKKNPQTNHLQVVRCCYGTDESQMEVYHLFVWLETIEKDQPTG